MIQPVILDSQYVFMWSSTLRHGRSLDLSWKALLSTWNVATKNAWLSKRVEGYARFTGLVLTPSGWHPHLHTVVTSRSRLGRSQLQEISARWQDSAERLGHAALPQGQHFQPARSEAQRAHLARYVTHQAWGHPSARERTPEAVLRSFAEDGDLDAGDAWQELEEAAIGKRLRSLGGSFRRPGTRI